MLLIIHYYDKGKYCINGTGGREKNVYGFEVYPNII